MLKLLRPPCLLILCSLNLNAEPRIWTSTSGSTIEATYLGRFGEDLWFEGTDPQKRLLKMPAKYISATDVTLIETKKIAPQITAAAIDNDEASIPLLEQLLKNKITEPIASDSSLKDAVNQLLDTGEQPDDVKVTLKFHRKVDEGATRTEPIIEPTAYACLQSLCDAHALKWSIRKGTLNLRPR